jgi:hypothetical protein
VIEVVFVQCDNLCLSSLVLSVANAARLRLHLAMKPGVGLYVGSRFLVAFQAAPVLPGSIKFDVALGAVIFPFGMRLG